jgi:tripartite-type tricarboxylate transporter receptor subunit TctC
MFAGSSTAGQIKAGKLRALAVTGAARSSDFPDLPAIAEMYPNYEVTIWIGLFAPAHTPASVLNSLRTEINRTLALPEFKARLNAAGGLTPYVTTLVEFSSLIRRDHTRYGKLVKETGIKPD